MHAKTWGNVRRLADWVFRTRTLPGRYRATRWELYLGHIEGEGF